MSEKRTARIATLTVEVPDRTLARTLLEDWAGRMGVSVNLVRGRVTPDAARYELEVRGPAAGVADILREGAPWSAPRRAGRAVPVPALA